jgi:SAM-dependent methyltransferase
MVHPDEPQIARADYEDQQGFSPTFASFAGELASALVDRYDLRGKTVLEIGCGKGDFLALVCDRGDNHGVGVDPLFRTDRLSEAARARITAVPELYAIDHARYQPDLIVCRHTLEHVPATGTFLKTVRSTLSQARHTAVVFEVPDVVRILDEGAFWDVYYEHCSYFSPGSMARAFRAAGMDVTELTRAYGDQYLILHARAAAEAATGASSIEEAPEEMRSRVDAFVRRVNASVERWRERLGDEVVIWGSGSKCVAFIATLGIAERVAGVVDISPYRQGYYVPGVGYPVMAPEQLEARPPETIIAMNPIYRDEIEASVRGMGLGSDVVAV